MTQLWAITKSTGNANGITITIAITITIIITITITKSTRNANGNKDAIDACVCSDIWTSCVEDVHQPEIAAKNGILTTKN